MSTPNSQGTNCKALINKKHIHLERKCLDFLTKFIRIKATFKVEPSARGTEILCKKQIIASQKALRCSVIHNSFEFVDHDFKQ